MKTYQCKSDINSEPLKTYVLRVEKQWKFSSESPKSQISDMEDVQRLSP